MESNLLYSESADLNVDRELANMPLSNLSPSA